MEGDLLPLTFLLGNFAEFVRATQSSSEGLLSILTRGGERYKSPRNIEDILKEAAPVVRGKSGFGIKDAKRRAILARRSIRY